MITTKLKHPALIAGTLYPKGVEITTPDEQTVQKGYRSAKKSKLRKKINKQIGDIETLLGTTSDAAQLLLFGFSSLISALEKANSLAEVRAAAEPFSALANSFLAKVNTGEVKLPFQSKGIESVVADIEQRATAVANVLESGE